MKNLITEKFHNVGIIDGAHQKNDGNKCNSSNQFGINIRASVSKCPIKISRSHFFTMKKNISFD